MSRSSTQLLLIPSLSFQDLTSQIQVNPSSECLHSIDSDSLLYGSNGTGKSSLCEGLEVSLLGYVAEADRKRIPLDTYIKNTIVDNGSTPTVFQLLDDDSNEQIVQSIDEYQYCFIEKNRIDDFSRISANKALKLFLTRF